MKASVHPFPNEISIKHYYGENFIEGIKIARENRLYSPAYLGLSYDYRAVVENFEEDNKCGTKYHYYQVYEEYNHIISILFVNEKPISVTTCFDQYCQAFTRKSMRRKGYAKMLLIEMLAEMKEENIPLPTRFGDTEAGYDYLWDKYSKIIEASKEKIESKKENKKLVSEVA